MDLGIQKRVALVTGGLRGIGLGIVNRLSEEGCTVATCDIQADEESVLPGDVWFAECDVSDQSACRDLVNAIEDDLGPVEILVNNVGIQTTDSVADQPLAEWEQSLRVNLTSAFILSQMTVPSMKRRGWGRVVNISSMAGKVGGLTVSPAYSASKAGMLGLTKSVARFAAPEATSNAVAPAFIQTGMTTEETAREFAAKLPVGRTGTVEEVAAAVAYLASDVAGYITGEVLDLNGGHLMD
ncbi:MAG: SDR family NAD(P)-dependent oxidoreductase [Armatimonadota bacterium]